MKLGRPQRLDPCPECGTKLDGASGMGNEERPGPGDRTVCSYCNAALIYGDGLRLRFPTPEEAEDMLNDRVFLATFFVMWLTRHKLTPPRRGT